MKNPKSNYIGEARRIKRNRMFIRIIVAGAVILILSFAIFFKYILSLKKDIDSEFTGTSATTVRPTTENTEPSSDVTDPSETPISDTETIPPTSETDTPSEPDNTSETEDTGTTTAPDGSEGTEGSGEDTTATTTVNLLPDDWSDRPSVLFPEKYPLQTVTHAQRDQSYSSLKHSVKQYIEEHKDVPCPKGCRQFSQGWFSSRG